MTRFRMVVIPVALQESVASARRSRRSWHHEFRLNWRPDISATFDEQNIESESAVSMLEASRFTEHLANWCAGSLRFHATIRSEKARRAASGIRVLRV